jgi:hypothetical protein
VLVCDCVDVGVDVDVVPFDDVPVVLPAVAAVDDVARLEALLVVAAAAVPVVVAL